MPGFCRPIAFEQPARRRDEPRRTVAQARQARHALEHDAADLGEIDERRVLLARSVTAAAHQRRNAQLQRCRAVAEISGCSIVAAALTIATRAPRRRGPPCRCARARSRARSLGLAVAGSTAPARYARSSGTTQPQHAPTPQANVSSSESCARTPSAFRDARDRAQHRRRAAGEQIARGARPPRSSASVT